MLCPAAASAAAAAAAAVWLLAVLGPGLSLPAELDSEPGFSLCSDCFYRHTPPQAASAGPPLRPRCHRLPGGQAFATLARPNCDTAVYSAFHLSHGWREREEEEGEEYVAEEGGDGVKVAVPALLRGSRDPSHPVPPTDSPLHHWDSAVTALVKSSFIPQCSTLGGDIYILTGEGGLAPVGDGDESCQTTPLWAAACCAPPDGRGGFSMGLINVTGEGKRQVSMQELEEMLGALQLFSEGCGGGKDETAALREALHGEGLPGSSEKSEPADPADAASESIAPDAHEAVTGSGKEATGSEHAADVDAQSEEPDVSELTRETEADTVTSQSGSKNQHDQSESVQEEADANSTSTLFCILSTTVSILKAPLRPLFSTITQLPEQVTYVLQEDLGVLSALPGDTVNLFHLLTSDLLSWVGSAAEMLLGVGGTCFSSIYYCSSSMFGALLNSCCTGFTGMGTLAGDTMGVFRDAVDNVWWVTKLFGGRMYEQSEGYVETVMYEMCGQAQAVGGGFGRLAWRGANGVGNAFRVSGGLIFGVVDMVIETVREAFGGGSQSEG
ncbi:unnamed protein product [Menidia menidia]|uniref:(Atlantic silverside) hypothetical protein n=1 Tax=Menidia menidia TaxID=238744 RepID=A0A8S4BK88_9TELE|nr:unnamed protein product [Menidia menidia]